MKRFWQIITLVLLALIVPASVCCYLAPDADCSACNCESIPDQHNETPSCPSNSIAHSEVPSSPALPEIQLLDLVNFFHPVSLLNEIAETDSAAVPVPTVAPPELRTTWVFASRAALPARAPSALA
ncbi:MAG: hypothetical protein KBF76_08890 [Verrucomicrobiales bacterium]|nr:hypothetical protein [Verrucomicrobiales bacterium]